MSAHPITVSFCLGKCSRHELVTLRDLFRDREARSLHLTGAVPVEYVAGIVAEAAHHGATARKVEAEIARQDHIEAAHRASMRARISAHHAAAEAVRAQTQALCAQTQVSG